MDIMKCEDLRWWVVLKVRIWDAMEYNELSIICGDGWYEESVHLCLRWWVTWKVRTWGAG